MKKYIKNLFPTAVLVLSLGTVACTGDLDVKDINPNDNITLDADGLFNKCYANFGLAGNGGGNGDCDIDGLDGGTTGFVRQLWNSNELPTDEAMCCWSDGGIADFNFDTFDASNAMLKGYYNRLTTGISYCNQYLAVAGDADAQKVAEIRFVRAFEYYLLMDAYGNIPFTTEPVTKPVRYTRAQAYAFIEKELTDIEPNMAEAKAKKSTDSNYGRVDKAADWLLLARLYLNAEVYTGTAQWAKAAEYAKKVMDSSYKLNTTNVTTSSGWTWTAYQMLFMGDNGETNAAYEGIFPILQDGLTTTSWGTSKFLSASAFSEDMHANPNDLSATNGNSINTTWGGNRARPDLIKKFFPNGDAPEAPSYQMITAAGDDRAIFCSAGSTAKANTTFSLNIKTPDDFHNGFGVAKFINFKTDGSAPHDATFPDADFFIMRSAEAYLIYGEANARLNGGNTTTEGTNAINAIRSRAHATTRTSSYSLSDICDEWSREFYFEGLRRPTLVRFGRFGGNNNYSWQWKGGTYEGRNFSSNRNIYAIPTSDLTANKNLIQNPGY